MIPPSGNASVSMRSGGRLKPRPPPRPPPPPRGAPAAGAPGACAPCAAAPRFSAATIAIIATELATVRIRNLTRSASALFRSWFATEPTDIGRLRDDLAGHRGDQLGASRGRRQLEIRAERVELEHIVVIARPRGRARAHIVRLAADVVALHGTGGKASFRPPVR